MVANDSSMGLNYRRRVIYKALNDTFADPKEIRHYYDLWQREHSHEAHFVVTRFAAVIAKTANFNTEQRAIFQRRLFNGLTQPYESLPRVPDAWMPAANQTGPIQAVSIESIAPSQIPADVAPQPVEEIPAGRYELPERIVFRAFAAAISAAIITKADRHNGVLAQAVDDLDTGRTSREQALHQLFKSWSTERFAPEALPQTRSQEDLRHFAHQLYLLAADLLGPMQADRLLTQAASAAERLPEAADFSPQMLL